MAGINLNDTTPAAAAGTVNATWQKDGSGNISAAVVVPVDMAVFVPGVGTNAQVLLRIKLTRAITFPASATLATAAASANATGNTTYTFKKNGSSFATVLFAAGGATGAYTQASPAVFAAGDLLEIDGPATADATLADVGLVLAGYRS